MATTSSIFLYLTIALLLLFLLSHHNTHNNNTRSHHRRLKLRSNFTTTTTNPHLNKPPHVPIPFDPIVADIERRREDKQWEQEHILESLHNDFNDSKRGGEVEGAPEMEGAPEWEEYMNAEDFLNDEDKFNVTSRLVLLFPNIDVNPSDGYISELELTEWNLKSSEKEVMHRTDRDMELHDKNHDGLVSWGEYEPPSWVKNDDNNSFGYDMGWWKEDHFNASDADADGFLNRTEFNDFLHPADSNNSRLLEWLCKEEIRERDTDKDGKLNFKEFFHGLFDLVRNYDEESHNSSLHPDEDAATEAPARKLFAELDQDSDGYLSDKDLLPIIEKLHPSERYYAKQQADYIITQADTDKDGRLTLQEMVDSPYIFYSSIFSDEEEDDYHDEFR